MADVFPSLVEQAAREFTSQCTGYAQFRIETGNLFKARVQATDIVKQFVGDVTYGKDPKGILFYNSEADFGVDSLRADFTYKRVDGPRNLTAVQVDFTIVAGARPFARFLARFDRTIYNIPLNQTAGGSGYWFTYKVAVSQVDVLRQTTSPTLFLQLLPIRKEVYFDSGRQGLISTPGVFMFRDIEKLKEVPEPNGRRMQVDCAPDRIVFFVAQEGGLPRKEFGFFLPNKPLDIGTTIGGFVTWRTVEPPPTGLSFRSNFSEEEVEIRED